MSTDILEASRHQSDFHLIHFFKEQREIILKSNNAGRSAPPGQYLQLEEYLVRCFLPDIRTDENMLVSWAPRCLTQCLEAYGGGFCGTGSLIHCLPSFFCVNWNMVRKKCDCSKYYQCFDSLPIMLQVIIIYMQPCLCHASKNLFCLRYSHVLVRPTGGGCFASPRQH